MCYHTNTPSKANLSKILKPTVEIRPYPELVFANGFEQPDVPVMKSDNGNAVVHWPWSGYRPPTAKFTYSTLNARSETVFDSPLFGDSIRERRCLMFVQGFYEWSKVGKEDFERKAMSKDRKTPYYISREDDLPFAMAGIWKGWGVHDGKLHRSLSIITTQSGELMTWLRPTNPRSTLILDADKWDQWLDPHATEAQVKELFQVYDDSVFRAIPLKHSPLVQQKVQVESPKSEQGNLF